jgi:hypothetical protein
VICGWAFFLAAAVWMVRQTVLREQPKLEEEVAEEAAEAAETAT